MHRQLTWGRVLTFALAAGMAHTTAGATSVLEGLPDGHAVYGQAPTREELMRKTNPALSYTYGDQDRMLVWTDKKADGTRTFTLATACQCTSKGKRPSWIILANRQGVLTESYGFLPRTTVPVSRKSVRSNPSTEVSASILLIDSKKGTLYQIRFPSQTGGCGIQDWQVLVLHDSCQRWQLVTCLPGHFADDAWVGDTSVSARWTDRPEEPLELTVTTVSQYREHVLPRPLKQYTQERYTGKLPLKDPKSTERYLLAQKGDTFNDLIARLTAELLGEDRARVRGAVVKLNPGLEVERLKPGQRIRIPEESQVSATSEQ